MSEGDYAAPMVAGSGIAQHFTGPRPGLRPQVQEAGNRQLRVPAAVSALQMLVQGLDQNIEELEQRLSPVLGPAPPHNAQGRPEEAGSCDLEKALCLIATRLQLANNRLTDLRARLEV